MPVLRDKNPASISFFVRKIFIPENEVHLTHNTELSELSPGAGMGMADRADGHVCGTANVTEMSEATETQQTVLAAQGWRAFSALGEFKQDLGASYISTISGKVVTYPLLISRV